MVEVCGTDCTECPEFQKTCDGCRKIQGKVFWAAMVGTDICPIYKCVSDKKLAHCGECEQLPCNLYFDLKDPSYSDEEHQKSIQLRVVRLKELR